MAAKRRAAKALTGRSLCKWVAFVWGESSRWVTPPVRLFITPSIFSSNNLIGRKRDFYISRADVCRQEPRDAGPAVKAAPIVYS